MASIKREIPQLESSQERPIEKKVKSISIFSRIVLPEEKQTPTEDKEAPYGKSSIFSRVNNESNVATSIIKPANPLAVKLTGHVIVRAEERVKLEEAEMEKLGKEIMSNGKRYKDKHHDNHVFVWESPDYPGYELVLPVAIKTSTKPILKSGKSGIVTVKKSEEAAKLITIIKKDPGATAKNPGRFTEDFVKNITIKSKGTSF